MSPGAARGGPGLPRAWLPAVLLLHLLPFASRPALIGGDEPHYALMAHSIAVDGDLSIEDEYQEVAQGAPWAGGKRAGQVLDRHLREAAGQTVFAHPVGLPALAAPLLAVQQAVSPGAAPDLPLGLLTLGVTFAALLAGGRALGSFVGDARLGFAAALAVYFASPLWYYGRIFMTEPYLWSFAVLALASLQARRPGLASLFLGLCLAMKETALVIVVPVVAVAFAVLGVRRVWTLAVGPLAAGVLFAAKNLALGLPALTTFQPYRLSGGEGLVGFLVDPERGLLWFAPLLVAAALLGWRRAVRAYGRAPVLTGAAILVVYFLASALWIDWRGGSSYGPRLLLPVLPVLALPLAGLLGARPGRLVRGLLAAAFAAGFAVNLCAALRPVAAFWSASVGEVLAGSPAGAAAGVALGLGLAIASRKFLSGADPVPTG